MSDAPRLLESTRRALDHRLARAQAEGRAPSLAAGLVRDGSLVWTGAAGSVDGAPPTPDTQYRIGSITKTFVAVLVLRLRDEGLLDLDDALETHLPGTTVGDRTVLQLLSHTAGIASETPTPWWERTDGALRPQVADVLGPEPRILRRGRHFHYSNPGFALLGALVARRRGRSFGEVLAAEVLEPLGLRRTTLMPAAPHAQGFAVHPWADLLLPEPAHDSGWMAPAGQLWSTVEDLSRFASFLLDGDDRVLPLDSLREMREPVAGTEAESGGYGLGMQASGGPHPLVGHGGSMPGFLAGLDLAVDDGLAFVAFANVTAGPDLGGLIEDLAEVVRTAEPRFPQAWKPLPEADPELLALTGPWYWGATPYAVKLQADRHLELVTLAARGRESRFGPEGEGTWTGLDGYYRGETLTVVRDAAGAVTHLDLGSFVLTRAPYAPTGVVPGGVDPAGWTGDPEGTPDPPAER
ncbi:serine hydrolase domain-containing protein [Microlunatus flavus]|uniref:CubicO group peptidase, beta-lactamase class C family n=1 Tax=Microlunatus flavus TaxID=1036181 RepID=A0A1H9C330_9ACTN|nr:serine hydrolase domain-containing protein [Microlunatus flavus]SEP95569.1 CubicO group peptidase, beta-lactamase class C family [Microlunatus flavus]